jgi:hypothetical protein
MKGRVLTDQERAARMTLDSPDEPTVFSEAEQAELDRIAQYNTDKEQQAIERDFVAEQEALNATGYAHE